MTYLHINLFLFLMMLAGTTLGQTIGIHLPKKINPDEKYLFYLHGGVVTELGNNATNQSFPEWGNYEYYNILDSLQKQHVYVISEIRQKAVPNAIYTNKIASQIDSLLKAGVKPVNIVVVGASAGSEIALYVSFRLKNTQINYAVIGGCWPDTYKDYQGVELYGRFLSIIEVTDPHGTCVKIFEGRKYITDYKEVTLNTGLSHGFIYKGYREWVDPLTQWFQRASVHSEK